MPYSNFCTKQRREKQRLEKQRFKKQQGAVLVISMVLLLVMTILGLTAASNATMESRMAANTQNLNFALQAAESAVEATVNDVNVLGQALNSTSVNQKIKLNSAYTLDNQPVASEAEINYLGQSPADGFSMGVNKNAFVAHNFEINGTGSMSGNVTSRTAQGVYRIAPSGS
jgi:type IV pilus assembly protein PilX